ncbi:TonB-dependent receptor [Rapidithrix thailandica]|uniref:TonB-dependent receptor n=1 Tax=Rapidithrix thailandica TaxID=413964 RepID=A0AAW9SEF0_9BACT
MKYALALFYICLGGGWCVAQNNNSSTNFNSDSLYEFSVNEILNLPVEDGIDIEIVSASKKVEKLFDTPLSATVLTREEIQKAGCTSIMEAMRLVPGMVVREQTNGNYDIHLRGLDNVPPYSLTPVSVNTTTLVMIDNRPVYNNFSGGTLWETLPVDISDVDRIEIIRGPASVMFGPNAVSGVINIITLRPARQGVSSSVNVQYGSRNSLLANASVSYKVNEKIGIRSSFNRQLRKRQQTDFYNFYSGSYLPLDSVSNPEGFAFDKNDYHEPELALDKTAANVYLSYQLKEDNYLQLSAGVENSKAHKAYSDNQTTALTPSHSDTRYVSLSGNLLGIRLHGSYLEGAQDLGGGAKYSFHTEDVNAEYTISLGKKLEIVPGINMRYNTYQDDQHALLKMLGGKKQHISTIAGSLRLDYQLTPQLRLYSGGRVDKFNTPDKAYISYHAALTYKLNENHLLRAVVSKAYRTNFFVDSYMDLTLSGFIPPNIVPVIRLKGNDHLELLSSQLFELGYRVNVIKKLQFDAEFFQSYTHDFSNTINILSKTPELDPSTGNLVVYEDIQNLNIPLTVKQTGLTLSAIVMLKKIQLRPFLTLQQTRLMDFSQSTYAPDAMPSPGNPDPGKENYLLTKDIEHKGTPNYFGGVFAGFRPFAKLDIGFTSYLYGSQTYYHLLGPDEGFEVPSKMLINAKVAYRPTRKIAVFLNAKNLLNDRSVEYAAADRIGFSAFGGMSLEF